MKQQFLFFLLFFTIQASFAQTDNVPSFRFYKNSWDSIRDKQMANVLEINTVAPSAKQQREILEKLLNKEMIPRFFLVFANHFSSELTLKMRKKYNELTKQLVDTNELSYYLIPETNDSLKFTTNETADASRNSIYSFRCLDFDSDGTIDLILFNQVYFGPSAGLVFYGRQDSTYNHLYDCSGSVAAIEKKAGKIYLRYTVSILAQQETEVQATVVFDMKTKSTYLDSKLYFAQQTLIPKQFIKPQLFTTKKSVFLRFSPTENNKANVADEYGTYNDVVTHTLFGNAVGEFIKESEGYIMAYQKEWAFVAFNSKVEYKQMSLAHGLEPNKTVSDNVYQPILHPKLYFCGWVEKKYLKMD